MTAELLLDKLAQGASGDANALRVTTRLGPVGGDGDKVAPPTYDQGTYAREERIVGSSRQPTVLLDSVQSQANRLEEALQAAIDAGEIDLPLLAVDIPGHGRVSTLQAPHRIFDAIFRDSLLDGEPLRTSSLGRRVIASTYRDATALFELCPTALLFGAWDSTSLNRTSGTRFARAVTSEIVGFEAVAGVRTSSRIDPLGILANAGTIYLSADGSSWTLEPAEARKEKDKPEAKPQKVGKEGKPSEINHGNITPTVSEMAGGVTLTEARQITVLSFPQLRRLHFPAPGAAPTADRDAAGRTVLAALAVYAIARQLTAGYFLRSRCHLIPLEPPQVELLGVTAADREPLHLTTETARAALTLAYERCAALGLRWRSGVTLLQPGGNLLQLVQRSDQLMGTADV